MKSRRLVLSLTALLTAMVVQVPLARAADPDPLVVTTPTLEKKAPERVRLYGFGGNLTFWEVTGVTGGADSYENQITFVFEPKWSFGKILFKGTWFEKLGLSGRLLLNRELAGNDAAFRNSEFANPALFGGGAPQNVRVNPNALTQGQPGNQVDGTGRQWTISDLWLTFSHANLFTIPKLKVEIPASVRLYVPTSQLSRDVGLKFGIGPGFAFKKEWKGLTVEYAFRFVKYFYNHTTQDRSNLSGSVEVNGVPTQPFRPETSGVLNTEWAVINAFVASYDFTKKLSLEATYLISNSFTYKNPSSCAVDGIIGSNVCTDGLLVGDVVGNGGRGQRDVQWFLTEVSYKFTPWFTTALGLSTYQPIRKEGLGVSNPFFRTTPTSNLTTFYLSAAINVEKFYARLVK